MFLDSLGDVDATLRSARNCYNSNSNTKSLKWQQNTQEEKILKTKTTPKLRNSANKTPTKPKTASSKLRNKTIKA